MGSEIQRVVDSGNGNCDASSSSTSIPSSTVGQSTTEEEARISTGTTIAELTIFIDEHDVQSGARQVLHTIRPTWRDEHVEFKLFTDGITNKLVGCFHKPPPEHQNGHLSNGTTNGHQDDDDAERQKETAEADNIDRIRANTVLIRVYGNKTDMLIDRKAETRNIKMLHEYGFAPSLFATFKNGLAYEYVPGVTLKPETVVLEHIYRLVARQMAEMHKVRHGGGAEPRNRVPMIESQIYKFLNLIPQRLTDEAKADRAEALGIPNVNTLRKEFDFLYGELKKLDSPIVFAHNDLLLGNVIYTAEQERVTFIDYEYADYNYQAFDIGNHFTEFPGIDEVDFALYPNREFQMSWLEVYLDAYMGRAPTQFELERLFVQVNQFALASHFLWLVWGLIQAEYSSIDFDFIVFASNRNKEYMKRRDEFLALKWVD